MAVTHRSKGLAGSTPDGSIEAQLVQLVERLADNREIRGSSPRLCIDSPLAQRQSTWLTSSTAKVRVLQGLLWLWCNGNIVGCDPTVAGSNPVDHPMGV